MLPDVDRDAAAMISGVQWKRKPAGVHFTMSEEGRERDVEPQARRTRGARSLIGDCRGGGGGLLASADADVPDPLTARVLVLERQVKCFRQAVPVSLQADGNTLTRTVRPRQRRVWVALIDPSCIVDTTDLSWPAVPGR